MMQGDSRGLVIQIKKGDGTAVSAADVQDIEVAIGTIKKRMSKNEVIYDSDSGKWLVPLRQEETFKFPASHVEAQVRVVWPGGAVQGVSLGHVNVQNSLSREVL